MFRKTIYLTFISMLLFATISFAKENPLQERLSTELATIHQKEITILELYEIYKQQPIVLVDIRSKELYEKGHILSSININLPILPQTILDNHNTLPKDKPIFVICCAKDRNAMFALLPLRMAGYDVYAVTGGGVDAWEYLKLPLQKGKEAELKRNYSSKLNDLEKQSLLAINPDYHMMNAGRSYGIKLQSLEKAIEEGKDLFVVEVLSEQEDATKNKATYIKYSTTLNQLVISTWLKEAKNQQVFLVGENDKELVLAVVTLRMLGYNALFAFDE